MTLREEVEFWTEQMNKTKHDKAAMVCFGIRWGLMIAEREYGLSPTAQNTIAGEEK